MIASRDLVALVADSHQARVLKTLLSRRWQALGLRLIDSPDDVYPHPRSDPGVYHGAEAFLGPFRHSHRFALVMLDVEFSGSPGSASAIEKDIQSRLDAKGWENRSQVIAINPELEAWVWSDSPHVEQVLGRSFPQIRQIATENNWWPAGSSKPLRPKELLKAVLRPTPVSAAVFGDLAEHVGLQRCVDPSFARLRETLHAWFGDR